MGKGGRTLRPRPVSQPSAAIRGQGGKQLKAGRPRAKVVRPPKLSEGTLHRWLGTGNRFAILSDDESATDFDHTPPPSEAGGPCAPKRTASPTRGVDDSQHDDSDGRELEPPAEPVALRSSEGPGSPRESAAPAS